MRSNLFKVLVCLVFASEIASAAVQADQSIRVIADPASQSTSPAVLSNEVSLPFVPALGTPGGTGCERSSFVPTAASAENVPDMFRPAGFSRPISKVKTPACYVPSCAPLPCCVLPGRWCGQWELSAQVFFARVKGTVHWPGTVLGMPSSDVGLNDNLGVSEHETLLEYSARYQFRPRWALFYSVMAEEMSGGKIVQDPFYFGLWFFPYGTYVDTKWEFFYQRLGILYQPILTPSTIVSVTGGWLLQDQKLTINSEICGNRGQAVDRTRNLAAAGIELQQCIQTLPNGATLSSDNRITLGWLDDTFLLDLQVGLQFAVPMNAGRWGYAKGGYRLVQFKEDRPELRLDTSFEGGFIEWGVMF